jgi:hypothetical protein
MRRQLRKSYLNTTFIVSWHRRELFTQFFGWLIRNGFIRRLRDRWPLSPDVLGEMDDIVTHIHRRLGRFIVTAKGVTSDGL